MISLSFQSRTLFLSCQDPLYPFPSKYCIFLMCNRLLFLVDHTSQLLLYQWLSLLEKALFRFIRAWDRRSWFRLPSAEWWMCISDESHTRTRRPSTPSTLSMPIQLTSVCDLNYQNYSVHFLSTLIHSVTFVHIDFYTFPGYYTEFIVHYPLFVESMRVCHWKVLRSRSIGINVNHESCT